MPKIIGFVRRENKEGEPFNALILQGGLELVKSQQTGRWYATSKKASITCTFDDVMCESLIGQEIPGSIQKVSCPEYEYTVRETGEIITLTHRWEYFREGEVVENKLVSPEEVSMPV